MASSTAANPLGRSQQAVVAEAQDPWGRSQQAAVAEAQDPWENAAAAWYSRLFRPTSQAWGTGTGTPVEAPAVDTWETRASMEAPSIDTRQSDTSASMESPEINTWDRPWYINTWERPSMEAESMNTWERESMVAEWETWSSAAWDNWSSWSRERRRSAIRWPSEHAVLARVTVGDSSALHCGVCSLPLEPPVFQCALGLAVCSACRGPDYRRCRAVESILETVRVPCPHAAHGCDAMLAYYNLHEHRTACAHAPHAPCPLGTCCFAGSMAALLDHFITLHDLPLTAEDRAGKTFGIDLRDGFNVVSTALRHGGDHYLLLLNVVRQPFGRRIAAVCVRPLPFATAPSSSSSPAAASKTVVLELRYTANRHYQESEFDVPFADLAYGFLEDNELAQFIVPKSVHPDDQAAMLVTAFISIK